jgi:iron complex transport system substrate-binding protein
MVIDQKTLNQRSGAMLKLLASLSLVALLVLSTAASPNHQIPKSPDHQISRIISLVPAVTEMLYEIGAGPRVVAVSSYDTYPPQVKQLPSVGALLDPNVERILSLKPDLVIVYGSQTDLKQQLARAGIGVFDYRHAGLADVTTTIRALGERTGDDAKATEVAQRIERGLDEIRQKVGSRPRPRTLLVFGRERLALRGIYASGGIGFLDDMLRVAGGTNVFADVKLQAVQASTEQILAHRPEVVLEARATNTAFPAGDLQAERNVWRALGSIPAVRNNRVLFLFDDRIVIPGPRVVDGTRVMAEALHPDAFK